MKELKLVFPTESHKTLWLDFIYEFVQNNEQIIPWAARCGDGTFESFLALTRQYASGEDIPPEFVPSTTYFLMDEDENVILGAANIRHALNDSLINVGGHIGYGVAPSKRRNGYATRMLALALERCREMGIKSALVTCDKTNIGSAKTILNNGGILEDEFTEKSGNVVQRYWINLR